MVLEGLILTVKLCNEVLFNLFFPDRFPYCVCATIRVCIRVCICACVCIYMYVVARVEVDVK